MARYTQSVFRWKGQWPPRSVNEKVKQGFTNPSQSINLTWFQLQQADLKKPTSVARPISLSLSGAFYGGPSEFSALYIKGGGELSHLKVSVSYLAGHGGVGYWYWWVGIGVLVLVGYWVIVQFNGPCCQQVAGLGFTLVWPPPPWIFLKMHPFW